MALVNPMKMLMDAKAKGKAVPAFNVLSLEMIQGVIDAAEAKNTPVIIQITSGAMKWARFEYIVPMVLSAAKHAKVDIAVHLDHSQDVELVKKCADAGFPSLMFDGSHFPIQENISKSQEVMSYVKGKNIAVEVEIGKVGGKEDGLDGGDGETKLTPEEVVDFYNQVKPDILAFAFGTLHGIHKDKEINLDFDLIKSVASKVDAPLVMHGSSGVDFKLIRQAIDSGVTKVNVGTDLLVANFAAIRKFLNENPNEHNIRKINTAGIKAITARASEYMDLFNQ